MVEALRWWRAIFIAVESGRYARGGFPVELSWGSADETMFTSIITSFPKARYPTTSSLPTRRQELRVFDWQVLFHECF